MPDLRLLYSEGFSLLLSEADSLRPPGPVAEPEIEMRPLPKRYRRPGLGGAFVAAAVMTGGLVWFATVAGDADAGSPPAPPPILASLTTTAPPPAVPLVAPPRADSATAVTIRLQGLQLVP